MIPLAPSSSSALWTDHLRLGLQVAILPHEWSSEVEDDVAYEQEVHKTVEDLGP